MERGLIPAHTLPAVYEFMNGREIGARITGSDASYSKEDGILQRYMGGVRALDRELEAFFFIEARDTIRLVNVSSTSGAVTLAKDLQLKPYEIVELGRRFRVAMTKANPADLSLVDRRIAGWEEVGRRLGSEVARLVGPAAQICFLPGRAFTGLPLHLVQTPGGSRLIEEHSVSYAPNFSTLLARKKQEAADDEITTLVTVTKETDPPAFKDRALEAGGKLLGTLQQGGDAVWLKEHEADHDAVTQAMGHSTEIVFECHGTTAGSERGYGICIADAGNLPPSVLSAEEHPEQSRFILTWQDIKRSPRVVVSIACSSGITEVVGGGVRFGLEQTLFSGGARVVISPLWHVEQSSSLAWLDSFYQNRDAHPSWPIEQAFQQACLDVKEKYPHFYFWGPFILNGSITRDL